MNYKKPTLVQQSVAKLLVIERVQLHDRCWLWVRNRWISGQCRYNSTGLELLVAEAPGGAWSMFGTCDLKDTELAVELKTTHGIINHQATYHQRRYPYALPGLVDILHKLFREEAERCRLAFRESHDRAWRNYHAEMGARRAARDSA